ncbi:MAG: tyrosine-type recombinase/integrase [Solirubrobacteraceae bacterium]
MSLRRNYDPAEEVRGPGFGLNAWEVEAALDGIELDEAHFSGDRTAEALPGTLRAYGQALRLRVYPTMADVAFYRVRRVHVQDLVDQLIADGVAPATINTTVGALGAIYARAVQRDELEVSPTIGVKVPAARNGRKRFATPQEAVALLSLLPAGDRSIWATAMYAGLRRGEAAALRWTDVDLKAGTIRVDRSWDPTDGIGDTKSRNRRVVPIPATLREHLVGERLRQPPGVELCFASETGQPFDPRRLQERADAAWKAGGMKRLTLHDCRHTFASFMIAANVNAKALSTFMGHSSVAITLDRYGHLMPGSEAEAAGLLDAYLKANA